jgi:hypothetical protein
MNIQAAISKAFLLLSFSAILLFSCKPDEPASLAEVLETVSPAKQQSSIDPTKDNLVEGKKGTKVFIPANSLQLPDGTYPKGQVTIELKEFYSLTDLLSTNLSTVSDSFLLETGGMIHLAAFSEGKELQVDKEKSLAVAFPNKNASKKMDTFYGDTLSTGQINWQPAFVRGETAAMDPYADSTLYENKISVCGYTAKIGTDSVSWNLKSPNNIFDYVSENFKASDSAIIEELCKKGQMPEMFIKLSTSGKVMEIDFDITFTGKDAHIAPKSIRRQIAGFLKSLPPFEMSSMEGRSDYLYLRFCCHTVFNEKKFNEQFNKKYSQYRDKAVQKIDPAELNYYILSTSKLGWINCDRFLNDESEKTNFIVRSGIEANSNVMIAFDNLNSVMQGEESNGAFVFKNIPLNSKVRVMAIAYKDGKPLLSKMPAIVTKQDFVMSGFSEFSLKDLENELNK